jgi:uncharacterized membrane protein
VIIGIVNHEYATVTYPLEIKLNRNAIAKKSIELTHNEAWEGLFTFKPMKTSEDLKQEFLRYPKL